MATHPAVAVAAAVAMPDPVFGERVCVFAELKNRRDARPADARRIICWRQGVSKELLPERLEVLDELPRSSGGKIAKGQLREDIRSRTGGDHDTRLTCAGAAWTCGRRR